MKKLFLAVAVLLVGSFAWSRVTSQGATDRDAWCAGPSGAEVCVDSSGNIIPTTSNDASCGSSSLRWSNLYTTLLNVSGAMTQTGALSCASTLDVNGATTLNSTLDVDGNSWYGAASYRSTNTAATGAWAFPATVSIGGALTQTGAANLDSTLDVDGNMTIGAATYRSTFTAASGNAAIGGTLTSAGKLTVTSGGADVAGTLAVTGAETVSTTLSVAGDSYLGAATFKSTNTAATGAWAFPASASFVSGVSMLMLGLTGHTTTQMETLTPACPGAQAGCVIYSTTNTELCVSSGTGQSSWVQVSSQSVAGVKIVATCEY